MPPTGQFLEPVADEPVQEVCKEERRRQEEEEEGKNGSKAKATYVPCEFSG